MGDFDERDPRDRKGGKPRRRDLEPGKLTNLQPHDATSLVPGKQSLTDRLIDDPEEPGREREEGSTVFVPGRRARYSATPPMVARDALPGAGKPRGIPEATKSALRTQSGVPVPDAKRHSAALGVDIDHARLVTGPEAAAAAAAVGARAFAVGHRIFFGAGTSPSDEKLLRHELAHVIQQAGTFLNSVDELPITSPDDAVEHEARAVAEGATAGALTSEPAIARDLLVFDAKTYWNFHSTTILADVMTRLGGVDLKLDSPYLTWVTSSKALVQRAFATEFLKPLSIDHLKPLLGDEAKIYKLVDAGRRLGTNDQNEVTSGGTAAYTPNVGHEIANELIKLIVPSFTRLVPRYCKARAQAKLAKEQEQQKSLLVAPEPAPGDVVGSHAIDVRMREAMCSGAFAFDYEKFIKDNPSEGTLKPKGKRPISYSIDYVTATSFWIDAKSLDAGNPVTAEEVSEELYGTSLHATEITGVGHRFGIRNGGELLGKYKTALALQGASPEFLEGKVSGDPAQALLHGDPASGMLSVGLAPKKVEEIALEQSQGFKATGAQQPEIVKRLGDMLVVFDGIAAKGTKVGITHQLAQTRGVLEAKEAEVKAGSAADAMKWDVVSARQLAVVKDIAGGMEAVTSYWTALVDKSDPQGKKLAADTKVPLQEVATGLVAAASHLQLPELANQSFAAITPKLQSLPFDLMESMLRAGERTMREVMQHDSSKQYKPEEVEKKRNELRAKISAKREEALENPAALKEIIDELFSEVGDVQTDTQLIANMDNLDENIRLLSEYHWQDSMADPGHDKPGGPMATNPIREMLEKAEAKVQKLRNKFNPIYRDWKVAQATNAQLAKTDAKARLQELLLDDSYRQTLQDAAETLNAANKFRQIASIMTMVAVMIVITIASMGIGTAIGAGVSGLLAGSVAAGTMAAGTASVIAGGVALVGEAAVFTALNAWLVDDKGFQNFGQEFLFNLATFGAMKTISKVYRSAALVKNALKAEGMLAKGLAVGGEMSLQFIAMNASAIAHEKMQGKNLSQDEINAIFAQSTGMFIAMAIAGRAAAPLFHELEAASGELGAKISGMNAERAALYKAAIIVKNDPKSSAIADLVKADKKEMDNEVKVLDFISKNEALIATQLSPALAKQIASDSAAAVYQIKVSEALGTARRIGPSQYHATDAQLKTIEAAYGPEAKVEPVGEDKTAGTKTVEITPPEGKGSAVRITVGEAKANETKIDATAQPKDAPTHDGKPNLDGVAPAKADEARWETNEVNPDAWAQPSKDKSTTFRDVYEKWIKQQTPYKEGAKGLEPIKPEGVSDAAWKEFQPEIKKALKAQNVAIKGGEITAKLKEKGVDLEHLDPESPQYQQVRPELIKQLGKAAVEKFEASLTNKPGDAESKKLNDAAQSVVSDGGMKKLTSELSSCQVMLTGGTTRPPKALGKVTRVEVIVIAPEGVTPEVRVAIEERANALTLEAGPGVVEAGGPKELPVSAKVMTREQYLGIKAADPNAPKDLRIDANVKTTSKEDLAAGYDAALKGGGLNQNGQLPVDAANLLTKGLPGAAIDPANPAPGIEAYLNSKNPAKKVTVEAIDPRRFVIKEGGKTVGTFTIYDNPTEMARELSSLSRIKEMKLDALEVTGATDVAKVEANGKSEGMGVAAEPLKGENVKDALGKAGTATGEARAAAVEKLMGEATNTAKAMAELHSKAKSGEKVSSKFKESEIRDLRKAWQEAKAAQSAKKSTLTPAEKQAIEAKLRALEAAFRKAELDATMTLGNADVANTAVQQGGKVSVDGSQVHESMGKDGKATSSAGEDVGRYLESLRQSGSASNLSPAEIARIEKAFLDSYKASAKGSGGAGLDAAIDFYKTKRAIEGVAEAAKAAKAAGDAPAAKTTLRTTIESLLHDLGLPSMFEVPADALTLDLGRVKRFEAWLADPKTKIGDNPKTREEATKRLRDYYARDPKGAIELANREYGFETPPGKGDTGLVSGDAATDAQRMLEYLKHADPEFNDGKTLTKEEIQKFVDKYKSGERFDPVTRRWYMPGEQAKTKSIFEKGKFTLDAVKRVLFGEDPLPMPPPEPGQPAPPVKKMEGFKAWVEMVKKLKIKGKAIATEKVIDDRIKEVGWEGKDVNVVRHEVKEPFKEQIVDALAAPSEADLKADPEFKQSAEFDWTGKPKETYEKARFLHMRRAVEHLVSGDAGNIVEDWRAKIMGITDPSLRRVTINPDNPADLGTDANGKAVKLDGRNVLDMVEIQNNKIVDNKDYSTALGPDNEPQLNEQLKLAGKHKIQGGVNPGVDLDIPVKDAKGNPTGTKKPIHVNGVKWSVTDPRGVEASADWMADQLFEHQGLLEFEVWNWKGERRTVHDPAFFSAANRPALKAWLGVKPTGFK